MEADWASNLPPGLLQMAWAENFDPYLRWTKFISDWNYRLDSKRNEIFNMLHWNLPVHSQENIYHLWELANRPAGRYGEGLDGIWALWHDH